MAEQNPQGHADNSNVEDTKQGGCFHFMNDKTQDDHVMMDAAKDELQRTHSHSTSSSGEEVEEGGERKKKKKKGLKEAIKEKITVEKVGEEEETEQNDMEKCSEEKKGILDKIKEKLPGKNIKKGEGEEETQATAAPGGSEKKGIIDMIKEKLPGHHKNNKNE